MTDIAQMRFRSMKNPNEYGMLVLSDDGTFRIVPSDDLRDEMARLEEVALVRSQTWGIRTGVVLLILGTLFVSLGWFVGRVFGKLGGSLSKPRPVREVRLAQNEGGGVNLVLHGLENRLQTIQMAWNGDEILAPEADKFIQKLTEMQGRGSSQGHSQG